MFYYGPLHMAELKQGDQLKPTYSSSVRIQDVALRICQKRWTIGRSGKRGSGISMLVARQDDDYFICTIIYFNCKKNISWIHRLKPVPVGVVSDVLIFWVIGEFRVFQHHTPFTRTTPSEMINFWVTYRIQR